MANPKISQGKSRKGLKPQVISDSAGHVLPKTSQGKSNSAILTSISSLSICHFTGFSSPKQSTFDRKAEEMKTFLRRNPVPKEFLK